MRRAAILSFSARGTETAARVAAALDGDWTVRRCAPKGGDLMALTARLFAESDALVFVGACGIAVRAVAPNLRGKAQDPAVLVVDERGRFVIALLSGHIGGANALARRVAAALGATPVITTATDVSGRFAADEWAARNGLCVADMDAARRFSAAILERDLPLTSDFSVEGALPAGLVWGDAGDCGLAITFRDARPFGVTLPLVPRVVHVGVGCKRGAGAEAIGAAVRAALSGAGVRREAVAGVASIDVKRDEPGLIAWAEAEGLPLRFYGSHELEGVEGTFAASEFVKQTVGVDNVCERAALLDAGDGARLIVKKTCQGGVTVAAALRKWSVVFE